MAVNLSIEKDIINNVIQRLLKEKERYLKIPPLLKHVNDSLDTISKIKLNNGKRSGFEVQRISQQEKIIPIDSFGKWIEQRTSYGEEEEKLSLHF